ncbi:MAG: cyanophycinase [Pseudobacteriovorax sp.]|nr:cyanophycinase [Pseudobacteriovorax sp.]
MDMRSMSLVFHLVCLLLGSAVYASQSHPDSYRTGSFHDVRVPMESGNGATLLMGGGADVDEAFVRVRSHFGTRVDVVVLRSNGGSGYNDYLYQLMAANSVTTLIIDTVDKANSDITRRALEGAEFVFIAGGDQSRYIESWRGTQVQRLLKDLIERGGVVGGTSAGISIVTGIAYDPGRRSAAVSDEVVRDYCHPSLRFSDGLATVRVTEKIIGDSHFFERDRMGRLLTFIARNFSKQPFGVGVSEATALFVESDGQSEVFGRYEVYVLDASEGRRQQVSCRREVVFDQVKRVKLTAGQRFHFGTGKTDGSSLILGVDGRKSDFYLPTNPY